MTSLHGIRPVGAPRITLSVVVGRPAADGGEGAWRCVSGDEVVQPSKGGTNGGRRLGIGKKTGRGAGYGGRGKIEEQPSRCKQVTLMQML